MKKLLFAISLLVIGSLNASEGNVPTGTVDPIAGTEAQVGYQAGTRAQIGYQPKPEIGYQAPNAGTEAQVGYQAGNQAQVGYQSDIGTRAEAMQLPKPELV